jgi:hypothetical protein
MSRLGCLAPSCPRWAMETGALRVRRRSAPPLERHAGTHVLIPCLDIRSARSFSSSRPDDRSSIVESAAFCSGIRFLANENFVRECLPSHTRSDYHAIDMRLLKRLFTIGYTVIVLLIVGCGLALVVFAAGEIWRGVSPGADVPLSGRFNAILEGIGLLTIAVAALELGQTILEEEVQRGSHISAPTACVVLCPAFSSSSLWRSASRRWSPSFSSLTTIPPACQRCPAWAMGGRHPSRLGPLRIFESQRRGARAGSDGAGESGRSRVESEAERSAQNS